MSNSNEFLDYFPKKKFSNRRFAIELIIFLIVLLSIKYFIYSKFNLFDAFVCVIIFYLTLGFFFQKLIAPLKFVFDIFFIKILSNIINPILIFIIYLLCIVPFGIIYKLKKNKIKNEETLWTISNLNTDNISLNDQF